MPDATYVYLIGTGLSSYLTGSTSYAHELKDGRMPGVPRKDGMLDDGMLLGFLSSTLQVVRLLQRGRLALCGIPAISVTAIERSFCRWKQRRERPLAKRGQS